MTQTLERPRTAPAPPAWQVWTALGVVYLVWGSTYLAIRVMVRTLPPLTGAGLRFTAATLLTGGYVLARQGPGAFRVPRAQLLTAAAAGLLLLVGGNGMVGLAEQSVPSGVAALLVALVPLYVVLIRVVLGERPAWVTLAGVATGFGGVALLLLPGRGGGGVHARGLILVGASLSWALGSVLASRGRLPASPAVSITIETAAGGVAMLLLGPLLGERLDARHVSGPSWLALAYLVLAGSVVAFSAYAWLLGVAPISQVSTYAYVNPVVAVLLGALLLGESVGAAVLAGGLLVVLAVVIVVRSEARARGPAEVAVRPPAGSEGG